MIAPTITSRIEQRNNLVCDRINTRQVWALAEIAAVTGKRQIRRIIASAMLPGNYVFDVMSQGGSILREEAILAGVIGPGAD